MWYVILILLFLGYLFVPVKSSVELKCVDGVLKADTYIGRTFGNVVREKYLFNKDEIIFLDGYDIICKKKGD